MIGNQNIGSRNMKWKLANVRIASIAKYDVRCWTTFKRKVDPIDRANGMKPASPAMVNQSI